MNQIATVDDKPKRQLIEVVDPVPVLDTSRFEHMQRIATVMARSSLIPDSLCTFRTKDNKQDLPYEQVLSNCFLVVNQAVRWGLDPFAVAQCVSVVHGKLCYEGKLVSAVLDAKLGLRLYHHFTGEGEATRIYLSDREFDEETIAELKPGFRKAGWRLFDGSVAEWKTTGAGTPWTPKNFPRMLIYRGTRDWTRIYESALMLGVYTPDEMLDLNENARALRARDVSAAPSLQERLAQAKSEPQDGQQAAEGFDPAFVRQQTSDEPDEADDEPEPSTTAPPVEDAGSGDDTPDPAADQSPDEASGGTGDDALEAAEEPSAVSSPAAGYSKADCIKAFLRTATDDALNVGERRDLLAEMVGWWKDAMPADLDFVKACLRTSEKIVKSELPKDKARQYLEAM